MFRFDSEVSMKISFHCGRDFLRVSESGRSVIDVDMSCTERKETDRTLFFSFVARRTDDDSRESGNVLRRVSSPRSSSILSTRFLFLVCCLYCPIPSVERRLELDRLDILRAFLVASKVCRYILDLDA